MFFDDAYPHEAWNDSDEIRVVLFMDVLSPLPKLLSIANRLVIAAFFMTPFTRTAKRNHTFREQRFEALRAAHARV